MKRIFEILVVLMLVGCASVNNEDKSHATAKAFGEGMGYIIKDYQSLLYSIVWHYRVYEKWPETKEELVGFIELHKAPINLSKFTTVEFDIHEQGDIKVEYTLVYKNVKREDIGLYMGDVLQNGSFKITKEEALNKDLAIAEFFKEKLPF
ncbi:MAG: hypothetical protein ACYS67_11540 [Planctomycetota bacterium]|jgi:hypothetical protein